MFIQWVHCWISINHDITKQLQKRDENLKLANCGPCLLWSERSVVKITSDLVGRTSYDSLFGTTVSPDPLSPVHNTHGTCLHDPTDQLSPAYTVTCVYCNPYTLYTVTCIHCHLCTLTRIHCTLLPAYTVTCVHCKPCTLYTVTCIHCHLCTL